MKKFGAFYSIAFVVLLLVIPSTSFADYIIIVCNSNVVDTSLTKKEVKDIFLGKKTKWSDKKKIHFATLGDEKVQKLFLKQYVNKTSSQYRNHWKQLVFTGKGKAPQSFNSAEELLKFVAVTDGAIGYIGDKSTAILGAFSKNIQTINVK